MWTLLDLVLPLECGGCAAPGIEWCVECAAELACPPIEVRPRVDPGVPCWALGTYTGPRRGGVIAMKERGRRVLAQPLGRALAGGIRHLRDAGEIDPPELSALVLICAPSRARAARVRGGDPVLRCARFASADLAPERVLVPSVLRMSEGAEDSVGLSAGQRQDNVGGRIRAVGLRRTTDCPAVPNFTVVLVDDVLTTGATVAESVRVLGGFGVPVAAVLVVASA